MKKVLSILFIGLMLIMILPFSVNAKSISTLDVTNKNNKLTVSGTTEDGVLAVAILVYSEDNLVHMETCSSNNNYSCELSKTFAIGDYTVKVADYDGGDYISKNVSVKADTSDNAKDETPKTGISDYIIIGILAVAISILGILIIKKKEA